MGLTKGEGCGILNKLSVLRRGFSEKKFQKSLDKGLTAWYNKIPLVNESGQNLEK